jgi:hypothetical protein
VRERTACAWHGGRPRRRLPDRTGHEDRCASRASCEGSPRQKFFRKFLELAPSKRGGLSAARGGTGRRPRRSRRRRSA